MSHLTSCQTTQTLTMLSWPTKCWTVVRMPTHFCAECPGL